MSAPTEPVGANGSDNAHGFHRLWLTALGHLGHHLFEDIARHGRVLRVAPVTVPVTVSLHLRHAKSKSSKNEPIEPVRRSQQLWNWIAKVAQPLFELNLVALARQGDIGRQDDGALIVVGHTRPLLTALPKACRVLLGSPDAVR